ncbi:MAG: AURKAIP1/COX24 domain-containing protein [Anaerolineae bacterium]|nr:AURKAIP1/COX24 domain-containing protein [Anaerolineae bacterium]
MGTLKKWRKKKIAKHKHRKMLKLTRFKRRK